MKLLRKTNRFIICYVVIIIVIWRLYIYYGGKVIPTVRIKNSKLNSCPIPVYQETAQNSKDNSPLPGIKCTNAQVLVTINNGKVKIINNLHCLYQCIFWKTDFSYELTDKHILLHSQNIPCQYFVVNCKNNATLEVGSQLIISAKRNETLIKQLMTILKGEKKQRDVFILGIDSMSYNAYKRYLPKIYSVLHKELDGVSFTKFNTMGDGTTVNLQGLLTGTKDTETYESRRRIEGAKPVDAYNWIWKHYHDHGYLTQYYEEMTDYGTFQYRLLGFEQQPTDIYLRTMLMYSEQKKFSHNFCLGNVPQHLELLRFYNEVVNVSKEVPKFSFIYLSSTSHDENRFASYLDNDIAQFLIETRKNNRDMVIILYADHGHRFSSRLSMQGKYEERLPFLGISLPDDLKALNRILKSNFDVVITGLDVHATLEDILGIYKPQIRGRHMSLLSPLPVDRDCADIESAAHWCACLNWVEVLTPNSQIELVRMADRVVAHISTFTIAERDLCAELKLDSIVTLYGMNANNEVLMFKQSADVDGFVPDLSDRTTQSQLWFRFVIKTTPGDAIFEVTISLKSESLRDNSNIQIDKFLPSDVSRINIFAPWVRCLSNISLRKSAISDIRKFCICKNAF